MDGKTGFIIGGGEFTDRGLEDPHDLLIAADSGLVPLQKRGIIPDVIIGDFDSLGYVPQEGSSELLTLPCIKDDTDMAAACRIAWEKGCRSLRLYGGSGSRPDHFLANLQLMALYSSMNGRIRLVAPAFTVYALTGGTDTDTFTLSGRPGITFSVFSHFDTAEGVCITGDVKYAAEDSILRNSVALGVSNEMTGDTARISVRKGTLLVFAYVSPEAAD